MSDVLRFTPGGRSDMLPDAQGEWIQFDAYEALAREVEAYKSTWITLRNVLGNPQVSDEQIPHLVHLAKVLAEVAERDLKEAQQRIGAVQEERDAERRRYMDKSEQLEQAEARLADLRLERDTEWHNALYKRAGITEPWTVKGPDQVGMYFDAIEKRLAEVLAALSRYGRHEGTGFTRGSCRANLEEPCTCGYAAALAKARP